MPKTHPLPWDAAEDDLLWQLYHLYKDDYIAIAIDLEAQGWCRTPTAIKQRIAKLRATPERKYVGIVNPIEHLAICKPWR
jgi:hypothetical protein